MACQKDWLEIKSDKSLVVPETLEDLRAILDNNSIMNTTILNGIQQLAEIGTDNYFLEDNIYNSMDNLVDKNAYIFGEQIFEGDVGAWTWSYKRIFYANVVIDGLKKIQVTPSTQEAYDQVKATALFMRAHSNFWLAQLFAPVYDTGSAEMEPGIPLRMGSDLNEPTKRSTLKETYEQIIADLSIAAPLLPSTALPKTRPTKAAGWGLLARVYLSMSAFEQAKYCSDKALALNVQLIDYNDIISTANYPVPQFNAEVLFSDINPSGVFHPARSRVDTVLYAAYEAHDLRKKVFYKKISGSTYCSFNGSYNGTAAIFTGIATDEIYLTRAECLARLGDIDAAMADLNTLLKTRWEHTYYVDRLATTAEDALRIILEERRKQLVFRGIRWMDLRRHNKESGYQTTIKRVINHQTYELLPNSKRYVYPIPDPVVALTGINQNER